ncbi:ankyrin [Piromyces finnis]|uniref:Ankyrin n=1 Tax=Piromyces finnis TaxID=1754191 RepID=A0A1Y1V5F5_9FUNG|nr:ankyrin [Piromyces finnis]|eukprot:ORX47663.1 ankyrin [Piromyces finnis]
MCMFNVGYNAMCAAGLNASGDTGGVEFIIPRIIPEFKNRYCFNDQLYIAFNKYSKTTEHDILNLLNNKLLIPGVKFNNMEEVFSTIMHELSIGYLVDKKLPFISLHFNQEGLLYSVMDEYYKHTLVGHVITMLDYFLKCYVNGGFFEEEFIFEWQNTKNTDKTYLDHHFINMKKYLLSQYGDKNKIIYQSLNDMKTDHGCERQLFLSAFRIIGKIKTLYYNKDVVLPKCYYDVEYDIDVSPEFKASLMKNEDNQNIIADNERSHKIMATFVKEKMNSIPHFKPYFELLYIITFCLHNLPNVQACELLNIFSEGQMNFLNHIVSYHISDIKPNNIEEMEKNSKAIEKKIVIYMYEKLKKLLDKDAYLVDITNDYDLSIFDVIKKFSVSLDLLVCSKVLNACIELNDICKDIKDILQTATTLKELNKHVTNLLNKFDLILKKLTDLLIENYHKNITSFKNELEKIKAETIAKMKSNYKNEIEKLCINGNCLHQVKEIMNSEKVKNNIMNREKEIIDHYKKAYQDSINSMEKELNEKLKFTSINCYKTNLINAMQNLKTNLANKTVLEALDKENVDKLKFKYKLNLQSLCFDLSSDEISKIEIRGGCHVQLNKNLMFIEKELDDSTYYHLVNNTTSKDYYCINSKLIQSSVHGDSLDEFVKANYDVKKNKIIHSLLSKENMQLEDKDLSGYSIGHYKALFGYDQLITDSDLNVVSDSGITPELIAVTTGNVDVVSKLIKLKNSRFSLPSHNAITPLLMAILNKDECMIHLLLDYPEKIGDINYTNELKKTALHYACEYNIPTIAKRLILQNSKIDAKDKKDGNTPLHLVCLKSNAETLKEILNLDLAKPYINVKRSDGKTPLCLSSSHSILCTKILLRNNANALTKDCYNHDCLDMALYSGRIDCYQQLYKLNRNIKLLEKLKHTLLSVHSHHDGDKNKLKYLVKLFSDGNLNEIEKVIPNLDEELPLKSFNNCIELIETACKGRKKESIKYLSQLIDLKEYPIMTFIGKNNLCDWIKEALGYGCDLFTHNNKVYNGNTIFDCCIESNDDKMLKVIFTTIQKADEKVYKILNHLICKAAINEKMESLGILCDILELQKFKSFRLSILPLCKTPRLTLVSFEIILKMFKCIDLSTIDLYTAIKFCRPGVFKKMLILHHKKLSSKDLEILENLGMSRKDNLYVLSEFYPSLLNSNQYQHYRETLASIENLLSENERFNESIKHSRLTNLLKLINIGLSELTKEKTFLPHLIIKSNNLWAMKSLPDDYANYFFIKDENQYYPFDYIHFSLDFKNSLTLIFDYFDHLNVGNKIKANYILLALDRIIQNFHEVLFTNISNDFDINDVLEKYDYVYDYFSDNNENIFYILSKNRNATFNKVFKKHLKLLNINQQNIEGETLVMNLIKNKNFGLANEIINSFNIDFEKRNKEGDSYLHLLFKEPLSSDKYDSEINIFYDIVLKVISERPSYILLQNRKLETPYLLAARIGCNTELIEKYSISTSSLHEACYANKINTVRYLIEYLNYDVNLQIIPKEEPSLKKRFNSYSTPIHCAAKCSATEIFKLLLQYGADPYLKDSNNSDAISIGLEYGNKKLLAYLMDSPFVLRNRYSVSHLLALIKNPNAEFYVKSYIDLYSIYELNSFSDETMNNILMISCINNQPSMINLFLFSDIELLSQNKYRNNVLHLCCYSNSVSCASEILSKINGEFSFKLLTTKNKEGNTPLHIASEFGLFSMIALFLSSLDTTDEIRIKNNNNLTPLQLSIKSNQFEIAQLFMEYHNLSLNDIKNRSISEISLELNQFITYYNNENAIKSRVRKKYYDIIYNKKKPIEEKIMDIKDKVSPETQMNNSSQQEELENQKIHNTDTFEEFNSSLAMIYVSKYFTKDLYIQYHSLIGNLNALLAFIKWNAFNRNDFIDKFFTTIANINNNKYVIEICDLFLNFILYKVDPEYVEVILNEMNNLFLLCNDCKNTFDFVRIIRAIILSAFESKTKIEIRDLISTIKGFRLIIECDPYPIFKNLKSIRFNISAYSFINNLLKICKKKSSMKYIHIKYAHFIPPLLDEEEINDYLEKYPIIHKSIDSLLPIDCFIQKVLSNKNIGSESLNIALECDQYIKNSEQLTVGEKIDIFESMKKLLDKNSTISKEFLSLVKATELYIIKFRDIKMATKILNTKSESISNIIIKFNKLNKLPEFNFYNYVDKLDSLLDKIEFNDKFMLKEIALHFNTYYTEYNTCKNFSELGRQIGQEFKYNPTLKNIAKLLAIISRGFEETLNYTPYLIQILAIASFLIHYKKKTNHGRIAQIKTGEGKSMIIAILALSNALMGYFVDVITSTHYLAKRDQIKFKKLFSLFGVSSSNLAKQYLIKEDYNGIILYGTNTDFEFTLLREGLFIQNKNRTQPLGKNELVERKYHVAIVDDANIAYNSQYHYNWVYGPIFDYVKTAMNPNVPTIRKILSTFEDGIHREQLHQIKDEKINEWINANYKKKEIQIISSNTGRIQYGSKWNRSIHEFVVIKEGLTPEEETSVIGSISHPIYFQNYQTIFRLTGTIGEEIEKREISKLYDVELYNLPRNFKEKLIIEEPEIYQTKEQKYQRIIKLIRNNTLKQPMLILLENIHESIEFSMKLNRLGIGNLVLNDAQKEKEEYILEKSGNIGNILVSTNAAGRGTDIILSKEALQVGGLYVILGFFPQNSRIEYQGIGRAGRQGQPGKAKVIFSKDESFVKPMLLMKYKNLNHNTNTEHYSYYYKVRKKKNKYFIVLLKFFFFKRFLSSLFELSVIKNELGSEIEPYSKFIMNHIDQLWANYYSRITSNKNPSLSPPFIHKTVFTNFLEYFLNELKLIQIRDSYYNDYQHNIIIKMIENFKTKLYEIK